MVGEYWYSGSKPKVRFLKYQIRFGQSEIRTCINNLNNLEALKAIFIYQGNSSNN